MTTWRVRIIDGPKAGETIEVMAPTTRIVWPQWDGPTLHYNIHPLDIEAGRFYGYLVKEE